MRRDLLQGKATSVNRARHGRRLHMLCVTFEATHANSARLVPRDAHLDIESGGTRMAVIMQTLATPTIAAVGSSRRPSGKFGVQALPSPSPKVPKDRCFCATCRAITMRSRL